MTSEHEQELGSKPRQVIYTDDGARSVEILQTGGLLSRDGILRHYEAGNIVIHPFNPENVGGASYDVCLGEYYWRERKFDGENGLSGYINLWSEDAAKQMWIGPFKAMTAMDFAVDILGITEQDFFNSMDNISPDDKVIPLKQGENILTHTEEFIGGNLLINTAMQARSSLGRSGITVCRCAGWGDPGFKDRWTMEVTNNSQNHSVILVVGRRIAQIVFWEVEPVERGYETEGKYQHSAELAALVESWKPENMLPKLYLDREVGRIARDVATEEAYRKFCESEPGIHYAVPPFFPGIDNLPNRSQASYVASRALRRFNNYGLTPNGRDCFQADDFTASIYTPSLIG